MAGEGTPDPNWFWGVLGRHATMCGSVGVRLVVNMVSGVEWLTC